MFLTVANVIINTEKVIYILSDPEGKREVTVMFDDGVKLTFKAHEAAEIWKHFDEGGWKEDSVA